ncbi:MAG TPA: 30S ribosome-binding factor RbfA [Thermoanaerobaculia bacterium]|nr:30S ribosome-binding factor RbfA [Thermoanaerobaculia bacterium]
MSRRPERVADLLRAEISDIVRRELRDPRVGLATVSMVEVSSDLRHARVKLSILGSEEQRQASLEAVRHGAGFVRRLLGQRLDLRFVPELVFELDRGAEYSQRISDILDEELRDEREPS